MNNDDASMDNFMPDLAGVQDARSLATFFDHAFDAVILFDPQERVAYWNPAAENLYGWTFSEALGKTPAQLFRQVNTHQEQKRKRQKRFKAEQGEVVRGKSNPYRKNGSRIWVQYTVRALFDAQGNVNGFLSIHRAAASPVHTSEDTPGITDYFARVFRDSPDAVVLTRLSDGMILEVNDCWQRMFGYEEQEVLGQTTVELQLFAREADRLMLIRRLQRHGSLEDERVEIRHKSGEVRHASLSVKKIEIDGLVCLLSILRDTTEHAQVEEQFRKAAELDAFRIALMEALRPLRDPVQIQTEAMRVVGERLQVDRVLYAEIDEEQDTAIVSDNYVRGQLPKLVGSFRLSEFGTLYESLRKGEKLILSDTSIYPELESSSPVSFAALRILSLATMPLIKEGRFVANLSAQHGTVRVWQDEEITFLEEAAEYIWSAVERAHVENALRESEERYRQIVEHANEGIWEIDQNLSTVFVNSYVTRMLGYTAREMAGRAIFDFLPAEDQPGAMIRVETEKRGAIQHGIELRLRRKDGSILWARLSTTPRFDDQGKFLGILGMFTDISEHKQVEEQLERSNRQLNEILKSINEDLYVVDRNWNFVYTSPSFTSKLGKDPNYFVGKNVWEMFPQHVSSPFGESLRKAMENGELQSFEILGQYTGAWYRVAVFPSAEGITVLGTDISERRRIELQLEQSNQRLNEILASIEDDFYVLDREWKFVYVSRLFASRIGKTQEDFVGNNIWEMFPKHIGTPFEEHLRATMEKGEIRNFEIPGKYTDAWYKLAAFPSAEGITVLGTDITQRKRVEEAARRAHEQAEHESLQLRTLLENLPIGVMVADMDGSALLLNRALDEIWRGSHPLESLPAYSTYLAWRTDTEELVKPEDWPISVALRTGEVQPPVEMKIQRFDGTQGVMLAAAVPIQDHNGKTIRAVAVAQDITERKQAEEALREREQQLKYLNETLEQQVQEKTAEVRRLASDLIEATQNERQRISHILHDDLQQRVYAVRMQLTVLSNTILAENERAQMETSEIEKQVGEMLQIIRHLSIDLSPPILQQAGLTGAVRWLAEQMHQQHGLTIETRSQEALAVPDEKLRMLLFNCIRELLFNVVKHAQASRAVVRLQRSADDLFIEVSDNGKGFPVHLPEKASSFGLPTLQHQLSLFGGRMEITSEPGTGTNVQIRVPAARDEKDG